MTNIELRRAVKKCRNLYVRVNWTQDDGVYVRAYKNDFLLQLGEVENDPSEYITGWTDGDLFIN